MLNVPSVSKVDENEITVITNCETMLSGPRPKIMSINCNLVFCGEEESKWYFQNNLIIIARQQHKVKFGIRAEEHINFKIRITEITRMVFGSNGVQE